MKRSLTNSAMASRSASVSGSSFVIGRNRQHGEAMHVRQGLPSQFDSELLIVSKGLYTEGTQHGQWFQRKSDEARSQHVYGEDATDQAGSEPVQQFLNWNAEQEHIQEFLGVPVEIKTAGNEKLK